VTKVPFDVAMQITDMTAQEYAYNTFATQMHSNLASFGTKLMTFQEACQKYGQNNWL
jgi:hypothetical protein